MNHLIEFLITSSVLIILVLIIRACFMGKVKNSIIYALWLVVLVRLICPVNFLESSFSVMNGVQAMQSSVAKTNNVSNQNVNAISNSNNSGLLNSEEANQNVKPQGISQSDLENIQQQDVKVKYQVGDIDVEQTTYIAKAKNINISPIMIVANIWVIGVLSSLSIFIISDIRFRRLLQKDRKLLTEYSQDNCKVYKTSKISTPCLYGVFAPAIYIPEIVLHKLSETNIEQILEHETRHYIHKDHLWSFVRCLMVSIYWFHPLVWVAAKLSKKDAELFCDESILARKNAEERVQYGEMLLNVARVCKKTSMLYPITAVHSGKKEMKKRIVFIGRNKKYYKIIALLLFVLLLAGSLITFTACKEEKPNKEYTVTSVVERINGFDVTIPHVEGLDIETEEYINEIIRKRIINRVKKFDYEGTISYLEYSVESKTEDILSILIQYDFMGKDATHPNINAFAINIDIENKKIINIDSVLNYEQIRYALDNNYLTKVVKNNHGIEGDSVLANEEILASFPAVRNNQFYISGNKIGLIIDLIYARGSYEILETVDMRNGDYGIIQYTNEWSNSEYTYKGSFTSVDGIYSEETDVGLWGYTVEEEGIAPGTVFAYELSGSTGNILWYFYITEDKIYKFNDIVNAIESLENGKIPADAYIVCQKEEMKDSLDKNEKGWHQYIEVKGDTIEYHSYNNQVEIGYYETIIWKKNVGIIFYQSGHGAERDSIKLEIEENNSLISTYNEKMKQYTKESVAEVIEDDFDGDGEKEAFVLVNFIEKDENGYDNSCGCELWYVKGDKVQSITVDKECTAGDIQMISVEEKHVIFNAYYARLGDGVRTAIYGVYNSKVKTFFEQNYTSLYADNNGLIAYGEDYFYYDAEIKGWLGHCSLPYNFYWNEAKGKYEEYVAEEIANDEFMRYSGAKDILDKVISYCADRNVNKENLVEVEKEYLKRDNDTIDINLILYYNTGERIQYFATVKVNGSSIIENSEMILEGNKEISLIESLNEFEKLIED